MLILRVFNLNRKLLNINLANFNLILAQRLLGKV